MAFDKSSLPNEDTDPADILPPGTCLSNNQYRISSYLQAGGFGITYLARNRFDRDVVVKECFAPSHCTRNQTIVLPRPDTNSTPLQRAIRSFLNEAQTLSLLQHPNIVRILHSFPENDTSYIVLEYIDGQDLFDMIEDKITFTSDQIVLLTKKLLSALAYIHGRNLLHGDISPDNICVRPNGDPVLIDFGSACKLVSGTGERQSDFSLVKDGYSPPEMYEAKAAIAPSSDLYALGASLYHAITGSAPLDSPARLSETLAGRDDPLPPLAGTIGGYPDGFLASIDKALALNPADRHATAQDWQQALAAPRPKTTARRVALLRRVVVKPLIAAALAPRSKLIRLQANGKHQVQYRYPPAETRVESA